MRGSDVEDRVRNVSPQAVDEKTQAVDVAEKADRREVSTGREPLNARVSAVTCQKIQSLGNQSADLKTLDPMLLTNTAKKRVERWSLFISFRPLL